MANIEVITQINDLLDANDVTIAKAALDALGAATKGATGDVVGPATATDNAIARFNLTTGKVIKSSLVKVSEAGAITAPIAGSLIPFNWTGPSTSNNTALFPAASTSHGAIAHSHQDAAMYYAHTSPSGPASWIKILAENTPVTVAQGGTGTASPTIVAGTNVTITGTWPNQTVNAPVSKQYFAKVVLDSNSTGVSTYQSPLARFTLPSSVSVNGNVMIFTGDVFVRNQFTAQPDGGVYLFWRRYGETDIAKHFSITLPTASPTYKLSVSLAILMITGSIVQSAFNQPTVIRTTVSEVDGTTCISVCEGNPGSTLYVPEGADDLITLGQIIDIEFGIVTINSSGVVTGSYSLNGFMEVSHI